MMTIKEKMLEQLNTLEKKDLLKVYDFIISLKVKNDKLTQKTDRQAFKRAQQVLAKCPGIFSDDIQQLREDRV